MLTLEQLRQMKPETIFAKGWEPKIGHWVAIRGGIYDWAVYATKADMDDAYIANRGDKVWKKYAVRLVNATPGAEKWYRL